MLSLVENDLDKMVETHPDTAGGLPVVDSGKATDLTSKHLSIAIWASKRASLPTSPQGGASPDPPEECCQVARLLVKNSSGQHTQEIRSFAVAATADSTNTAGGGSSDAGRTPPRENSSGLGTRKRRFHNVQSPGRDGGNVAGVDGDDSHPTAGKKPKTGGSGDARPPAMEFAFVKQTLMTPGGDAPSPLILLSDVINEWEFGAAMFKISGNGKPTVPLVVFSEQHFTGKARDRLGTVLTVLRKQEANPRVLLMTGHAPSEAYDCVLRAFQVRCQVSAMSCTFTRFIFVVMLFLT